MNKNCNVIECNDISIRSLSKGKASGSSLNFTEEDKRIHLCGKHYKTWKKETKKQRELERIRYG